MFEIVSAIPNLNPPIRLRCGSFVDHAITGRAGRALPVAHELLPADVTKNVFCMQQIFFEAPTPTISALVADERAIRL
jgi:hypothetical protein